MSVLSLLKRGGRFEIQAYKQPEGTARRLKQTHVPFSGSPARHPDDDARVVLVPDPYSTNACYYEFLAEDVEFVERLPSLTDAEGNVVPMVRFWVKKGRVALMCTPFVVDAVVDHE